jgi:hypothetical protein
MSAVYSPICRSIVEFMLITDRDAFFGYLAALQGGAEPERAMQQSYRWTYENLSEGWRQWALRHTEVDAPAGRWRGSGR